MQFLLSKSEPKPKVKEIEVQERGIKKVVIVRIV